MIGGRPRADFVNLRVNEYTEKMHVEIAVGGTVVDAGTIDLGSVIEGETLGVSYDRDILMVGEHIEGGEFKAKRYCTPDSVYYQRSRDGKFVSGFNNYKAVCNYDLPYVGIANSKGSFDRLIKKHTMAGWTFLLKKTSDILILATGYQMKSFYLRSN